MFNQLPVLRRAISRVSMKPLFLAAGLSVLVACSPPLDWRELRLTDTPIVLMLPARPAQLERDVRLLGRAMTMHMVGAKAADHIFTGAWIDLRTLEASSDGTSEKEPPSASHVLDAMVQGMLRNIAAEESEEQVTTIGVVDVRRDQRQVVPARLVKAHGRSKDGPIQMQGLFVALPTQAHQFIVLGATIDEEAARFFFEGARVLPFRALKEERDRG